MTKKSPVNYKKTLITLFAALTLTACASTSPNTEVRFTITLSGPGGSNVYTKEAGYPPDKCIYNLQVTYPGNDAPSEKIPRKCANGGGGVTGSLWPYKGPFKFAWDATPTGPHLEREVNLIDFIKKDLEGGRLNFVFKQEGYEIWFQKGLTNSPNCLGTYCMDRNKVLILTE